MTKEEIFDLIDQGSEVWNKWVEDKTKNTPRIELRSDNTLRDYKRPKISFTIATFPILNFSGNIFNNFDFSRIIIHSSEFYNVTFIECKFYRTQFNDSIFRNCRFKNCRIEKTQFINANLNLSKFIDCVFINSNLSRSEQYRTEYHKCSLKNTNLMMSKLIETCFFDTIISRSRIYGASIWSINLDKSETKNLIITKQGDSEVSVDNIEIAQFIYMLIDNKKIRNIVTSLTSKVVLILGRFTEDRLDVLEAIKDEVTKNDHVPILFTFSPSPNRDLTETIQLIANMAKMVIADITDPKSIPHELSHIIPNTPSLLIQPILLSSKDEYGMFEHWVRYDWVKEIFKYHSKKHLIDNIPTFLK